MNVKSVAAASISAAAAAVVPPAEALAAVPKLTFYNNNGRSCPYAHRAWIALEEAGLPYDTVLIDLQDKPADFVELYGRANPLPGARAKVPVLHVEGGSGESVITESLVVAEYVAELHAEIHGAGDGARPSLLPPSAEGRATMRLFTELCSSSFSYFPVLRAKDEKALEAALAKFKTDLANVDTFLQKMGKEGGPFLFGDRFTLAECSVAPFVQRACAVMPMGFGVGGPISPLDVCDELELPRLRAWIEAVAARPSVVRTGLPKEELKKNMERMFGMFDAMEKAKK